MLEECHTLCPITNTETEVKSQTKLIKNEFEKSKASINREKAAIQDEKDSALRQKDREVDIKLLEQGSECYPSLAA